MEETDSRNVGGTNSSNRRNDDDDEIENGDSFLQIRLRRASVRSRPQRRQRQSEQPEELFPKDQPLDHDGSIAIKTASTGDSVDTTHELLSDEVQRSQLSTSKIVVGRRFATTRGRLGPAGSSKTVNSQMTATTERTTVSKTESTIQPIISAGPSMFGQSDLLEHSGTAEEAVSDAPPDYSDDYLAQLRAQTARLSTQFELPDDPSAIVETEFSTAGLRDDQMVEQSATSDISADTASIVIADHNSDAIPDEGIVRGLKERRAQRADLLRRQLSTDDDLDVIDVCNEQSISRLTVERLQNDSDGLGDGLSGFEQYVDSSTVLSERQRLAQKSRRTFELHEALENTELSDEDDSNWQEEQIRKGTRAERHRVNLNESQFDPDDPDNVVFGKAVSIPDVLKKLKNTQESLEQKKNEYDLELSNIDRELQIVADEEARMKDQMEKADLAYKKLIDEFGIDLIQPRGLDTLGASASEATS